MLNVKLDEASAIVILELNGELTSDDFKRACEIIDPYLLKHDCLQGIIIHVESFPGWDSFSAFISHLNFVKEHHKRVARIALATDSFAANVAESLVSHFVSADIKSFAFNEFEEAKKWVVGIM